MDSAWAVEKTNVAIFEIKNRGAQVKTEVLLRLREILSASLIAQGNYRVVPANNLQKALLAKKIESYDARFSQEHQIELGKEVSAQAILSTQIIKLGRECLISSALYDLQKAKT